MERVHPFTTCRPFRFGVVSAAGETVDRRWPGLAVVAIAQLMIALDATVVNIALPSAQAALGFADADRQWSVSAYTLAFGGLLLVAGRLAVPAEYPKTCALDGSATTPQCRLDVRDR